MYLTVKSCLHIEFSWTSSAKSWPEGVLQGVWFQSYGFSFVCVHEFGCQCGDLINAQWPFSLMCELLGFFRFNFDPLEVQASGRAHAVTFYCRLQRVLQIGWISCMWHCQPTRLPKCAAELILNTCGWTEALEQRLSTSSRRSVGTSKILSKSSYSQNQTSFFFQNRYVILSRSHQVTLMKHFFISLDKYECSLIDSIAPQLTQGHSTEADALVDLTLSYWTSSQLMEKQLLCLMSWPTVGLYVWAGLARTGL